MDDPARGPARDEAAPQLRDIVVNPQLLATEPRYPNLSNWPNNPLFYNPTLEPCYKLTKGLSFAGNTFLVYSSAGPNPQISAWLARRGYGTRWKPGA